MAEHVIVLSPGLPSAEGKFPEYIDNVYIGGDIRMAAARQLVKNPDIILTTVGGVDVDKAAFFESSKASAMRRVLCQDDDMAWRRVIDTPSLPCTYHNLVACFNELPFWEDPPTSTTILTNEYHIPRTKAFAMRALAATLPLQSRPNLTYVSAENILSIDIDTRFRQDKEYAKAYQKRVELEERGLAALEAGQYSDPCFRKYKETLSKLALLSWGKTLFTNEDLTLFDHQDLVAASAELYEAARRQLAKT